LKFREDVHESGGEGKGVAGGSAMRGGVQPACAVEKSQWTGGGGWRRWEA
jgi:hypothetical protein